MGPQHADVLLVGGGVAAARCARTLRRGGFGGSILLVGEEELPPYNRPPLSKELLRDDLPDDLVLAEPAAWYERRGVELTLGVPAVALDPDDRAVQLADGTRLTFGSCLLATGALPRRPPLPGRVLRTLADARAIRDEAPAGARVTVIGGGFIGVEVSASLAARGARVTLLERSPALWGGAFGPGVGAWAAERLLAAGVELRLGTPAAPDDAAGAGLVIAGVGVAPRVELAVDAGLEVDDGIVVDASQATSVAGVHAAGDVARLRGRPRVEHWHAARESGERAALAMLGQPVPSSPAPWIFSEFADAKLDVVGWEAEGEWRELAPSVHALLDGTSIRQVAILDGALPVEPVRGIVGSGVPMGEMMAALASISSPGGQ
jgi:3-phenylpropionate/trans-cinnamate dioxygenase ferredoxin reductase subunit